MAPELISEPGTTATFKADIYSTAATIYRMLTGRHPIEAKKLDEWFQAIQTEVPPTAKEVQPGIPDTISKALDKALAKDPADRHDSITELARDLFA